MTSVSDSQKKLKRNTTLSFLLLTGLAFSLSFIPVLHWPFGWMETFFHEISHGLMAFVTGGAIKLIELNIDGSGLCTSAGGIRFFVSFSGYAGSALWGALIYTMADNASTKSADRIAGFILTLFAVTALFWARDIVTWAILGVMSIPFFIILKTKDFWVEKYFMQFSGLYIVCDAVRSPLNLFYGGEYSDSKTLQGLTWLPEFVWIFIWVSIGGLTLLFLLYRHILHEEKSPKELEQLAPPKQSEQMQKLKRLRQRLRKK